jgi:Secretion system C-terminal sorting domain
VHPNEGHALKKTMIMELAIGHLRTERQRIVAANIDLFSLAGGRTVLFARSLSAIQGDYIEDYEDYELCGSSNIQALQRANDAANIHIFPNPANDYLAIDYVLKQDAIVLIYDLLGRTVLEKPLSKDNEHDELTLSSITDGVYWCKVVGNDGRQLFLQPLLITKY